MAQKEPDVTHYRRLVQMHRASHDPLVVVRVEDLATLLECYQHYADHKPRERRQAKGVPA